MYTLMIVPTRHHGNAHNVLCCRHAIEMFEKFTTGNPDDELKRSMSSSALMACSSSVGQNPPFQSSDGESIFSLRQLFFVIHALFLDDFNSSIFFIGHVSDVPSMQLITGISRNTQSISYMLSLTECVWEFQNNALWDTH